MVLTDIIDIFISVAGIILVVFGWIIPYKQSLKMNQINLKFEEDLQKRRWEKELIDQQISCLYGPLHELIEEQNYRWELILYQLGRDHIFSSDIDKMVLLPENEQKIWRHFVDVYKIPLQNKMIEIIRNNQHLMYKSEVPDSYRLFMEYAIGWELLDNQHRNDVPNYYEYYYKYNYPKSFNTYINNTLAVLLKRQEELISITKDSL